MSGAAAPTIVERLEATIARVVARATVRAIFLTEADRAELDGLGALTSGEPPTYRGYRVGTPKGKAPRSVIYTNHGVAHSVRSTVA